jgi:hypothetical protein
MTHEANITDELIEEEWKLACEELAKETEDKEGDPPQA